MASERKLSRRDRLRGIGRMTMIALKASPSMVIVKAIGAVISSVLPIITTYFAALTTTELAAAYAGDDSAGERAMFYIVVTAALGVVQMAWSSVEQYISNLARFKIVTAVSDRMYEQFLGLEFWQYDSKRTADLYDKASQFSRFFGYVFDSVASIVTATFSLVAGVVALLVVSWQLSVLILIALIPGILIQFTLSKKRALHWRENTETRRVISQIEYNTMDINNIAELRIYGLVRHLLDIRLRLREKDEKTRIDFERKFIGWQLGSDALEAAAEVIALLYTTLQIIAQTQPVGQLLYVQQITSRAMGNMRSLVRQLSSIDEDIANLFDFNEFMELPTGQTRKVRLTKQPTNLVFDTVSFRYPEGEQDVLSDVSLTIKQGQHIAIVGENGAGKSTFIKLLLGLYNPTAGTVKLDDVDLAAVKLLDWHKYIGVLQQSFIRFIFATARDNVLLGDVSRMADEKRMIEALERAEAKEFIEKLPKGLDNYVHQWMEHADGTSGGDLSGGQWQRLALARSFYRNSPIIILDEPTSAIDALAESRIFKRLFAEKDKTIITISHRLSTVQRADVIYVFEDGKIVEQGTHMELAKKKGAYFTLFESQM